MAAGETIDKPAGFVARTFARLVPARVAGSAYTRLIRGWSSVLNEDRP